MFKYLFQFLLILIFNFSNCIIGSDCQYDWEKTRYIWNFGIISSCDAGVDKMPLDYFQSEPFFNPQAYSNIAENDLVWVPCRFISQFSKQALPCISVPFVLVISDGDESFPSDCGEEFNVEEFINNKNIKHIFVQNLDYSSFSNKVSYLPIGMDFHTIAYKGDGGWGEIGSALAQEEQLNELLNLFQPTFLRKKRIFVDFQLSDTMHGGFMRYLQFGEDRQSIFNRLLLTNLIDYSGFIRRSELWKTKGEYAFSISPHGNGLDCHRTWEDLILGCIVIVKTSSLDPLYEGLPVVIVNDWSEITEENLDKWLLEYGDAFTNPQYREKLTLEYWLNKIQAVQKNY